MKYFQDRRLTTATLMLLCQIAQDNETFPVQCARSVIKMAHVAAAEIQLEAADNDQVRGMNE